MDEEFRRRIFLLLLQYIWSSSDQMIRIGGTVYKIIAVKIPQHHNGEATKRRRVARINDVLPVTTLDCGQQYRARQQLSSNFEDLSFGQPLNLVMDLQSLIPIGPPIPPPRNTRMFLETNARSRTCPIKLLSNHYAFIQSNEWIIYQYEISIMSKYGYSLTWIQSKLEETYGHIVRPFVWSYQSNSHYICCFNRIPVRNLPWSFNMLDHLGRRIQITIRFDRICQDSEVHDELYQFFLNKIMSEMGSVCLENKFMYPQRKQECPATEMVLWPTYTASIDKYHHNQVMLRLDTSSTIITTKNCYEIIKDGVNDGMNLNLIFAEKIVISKHNKETTYRISSLEFGKSPSSRFGLVNGAFISYADHYYQEYNITEIKHIHNQPLFIAYERNVYRPKITYLIPELCQLVDSTTPNMRKSVWYNELITRKFHLDPVTRFQRINEFRSQMEGLTKLNELLRKWHLKLSNHMVNLDGRVFQRERIFFKNTMQILEDHKWYQLLKRYKFAYAVELKYWAVIVEESVAENFGHFKQQLCAAAVEIGFNLSTPKIFKVKDGNKQQFITTIKSLAEEGKNNQLIFVILPDCKMIQSKIKRTLLSVCGNGKVMAHMIHRSQITNVDSFLLNCLAFHCITKINIKLGGENFRIASRLKDIMVVGFEANSIKGVLAEDGKLGVTVATLDDNFVNYFNTTVHYDLDGNYGNHVKCEFRKCLDAYNTKNRKLPKNIIYYRRINTFGEVSDVAETDLDQILGFMPGYYHQHGAEDPAFTYIVVNPDSDTRLFTAEINNPPIGTVVHKIIGFRKQLDFYLVSAPAKDGSCMPVYYNVLKSQNRGMDPHSAARWTYKFCHLSQAEACTTNVPGPLDYAHRIYKCFLEAYCGHTFQHHTNLSHSLYFV